MLADTLKRTGPGESRFPEPPLPDQAHHQGTLFGCNALNLLDKAFFVATDRQVQRPVVMVKSSNKVEFRPPVGERAELTARVEWARRASITVVTSWPRRSPRADAGSLATAAKDDVELVPTTTQSTAEHAEEADCEAAHRPNS